MASDQDQGNEVKGKEKMIMVFFFFYKDIFFFQMITSSLSNHEYSKSILKKCSVNKENYMKKNYIHNVYT